MKRTMKWFECNQAGTVLYEVETGEIQRAITAGRMFLCTKTMESVLCAACVI
jgi:hypothetical protein